MQVVDRTHLLEVRGQRPPFSCWLLSEDYSLFLEAALKTGPQGALSQHRQLTTWPVAFQKAARTVSAAAARSF